jgi:hypothetical protein
MYSSSIIQRLREGIDTGLILAYFYCEGDSNQKQDVRNILGHLLRQLTSQEGVFNKIKTLYDEYQSEGGNNRFSASPGSIDRICNDFESLLGKVVTDLPNVYVVIDGLDECQERRRLLRSLKRFGTEWPVHLLVSSRPEGDIKTLFSDVAAINIDEDQLNRPDIFQHIDWAFEYHEELRQISSPVKEEIKGKLKAKSDGM